MSRDSPSPSFWTLDPTVVFLNHGSFGACPRAVLDEQSRWRKRMERQPVRFFARDLEGLLDEARARLARFVGADPAALVWVPNVTTAVNAVLRSLPLRAGDELLVTDHEYDACRNVLEFVARRAGARVIVATVPFPVDSEERVVRAVLDAVSERTRLAMIDHVTSQTGLVLPVERLVQELGTRGVEVLVDGAHAPGMLSLDLDQLGADYYTGNCHKWLCAPKGAAFLHVRADRVASVRPAVISHGASSSRTDRPRLLLEFDWTGTDDPTAVLSVPAAIELMGSVFAGGWSELRRRNRETVLAGRRTVCEALGVAPPAPESMIGSLASIPLPPGEAVAPLSALYADPLQDVLLARWSIEVPIIPWPAPPERLLRISAQAYNDIQQYRLLATALREILGTATIH